MAGIDHVERTRVTDFEGKPWPCFVFPDHSVPGGAIEPRPHRLALPVLIMKRHVFEWRSPESLREYVPSDHTRFGDTRAEKERRSAFDEALRCEEMPYYHELTHSKNTVVQADSDDDDDDDDVLLVSQTPVSNKRPFSSAFKRPSLPTPSPTPKHTKTTSKFRLPATPSNPFQIDEDSDDDLPDPSTFTPSRKPARAPASKWKPSGKAPKVAADDVVTRKQLELLMIKKGDGKTKPEKPQVFVPVKDPLKVNVFVGEEDKLFILDRGLLQAYPGFKKHITGDDRAGFTIRNATFEKLIPTTFESVISWLKTADYEPLLVEGKHPYLKGIRSAGQFEEAAEEASRIWNIAHKFELTALQELVYRKIEVQSPLGTSSLLIMTRMVYWNSATDTEADKKMREMLRLEVAKRLQEILEDDALLFSHIIKCDVELANFVWQYQIDHPWEEAEEQISEDEHDDEEDD